MAILDVFKKEDKKPEAKVEKKTPSVKKEEAKTPAKTAPVKKVAKKSVAPGKARIDQGAKGGEKLGFVIQRPRITEKASFQAADGVYTFMVHQDANKIQIKRAIKEIYGIKPVKVNIIVSKKKNVFVRGKKGAKAGSKKALVYLKEGDKIEFV